MKYFTKEWYELCQKTSFHFSLEEEKQAKIFSEEYFQQLYSIKLNDWLDLQQQFASHIEKSETVGRDCIQHEIFNKEKAIEQFHESFIYSQEYIKESLPERILKGIADIRVFVLDKASRNVIKAVTKFCEDNRKSVNKTSREYRKYYKKALKFLDENIVKNIRFHDCVIINSNQKDKSLILSLDNRGGFTNIDEVVFENYNIVKQEGSLENSWWRYNEIYKVNDKYELHVLLINKTGDLIEFIISAEHIAFNCNKNN
ncbi:DUF4085 domain-containing protein [Clostridium malenominatum]|uniref:DUF4085 domain-containing protein n=1 Tax=Clostridium malenominatum TaxID=1539 RepID=A0ABN1J6Y6_9CLOT